MKLYLVRHGEALFAAVDSQRSLSNTGCLQVKNVAKRLQERGAHPKHIFHSGILRAEQTAQILAEELSVRSIKKIANLLPEDAVESIFNQTVVWTEDTLLVGHLPYMSRLLSMLSNEGYGIEFGTATVVCLEKINAQWMIEAVLNPMQ